MVWLLARTRNKATNHTVIREVQERHVIICNLSTRTSSNIRSRYPDEGEVTNPKNKNKPKKGGTTLLRRAILVARRQKWGKTVYRAMMALVLFAWSRQNLCFTSIVKGGLASASFFLRRFPTLCSSSSFFYWAMNRPSPPIMYSEVPHFPASRHCFPFPLYAKHRSVFFSHPSRSFSFASRPRFTMPSSSWVISLVWVVGGHRACKGSHLLKGDVSSVRFSRCSRSLHLFEGVVVG